MAGIPAIPLSEQLPAAKSMTAPHQPDSPTTELTAAKSEAEAPPFSLLILIPVFNDWDAVTLLLHELDRTLHDQPICARVLLIDDGSTQPLTDGLRKVHLAAVREVKVLALRRNLGHQRAIAVGLAHVAEHETGRAVLIMDGDGQDAAEDVPRLVQKVRDTGERCVVFAERRRRSEAWWFQACYHIYRVGHLLLTGLRVRVGNFSIIPWPLLRRLVVVWELWNHYSAAVFKSRLPLDSIPTHRAGRLAEGSRMNFVALTVHGLSALSVHSEVVGVRLLLVTLAAMGALGALLAGTVAALVANGLAVPGWVTAVGVLSLALFLQASMLAIAFVFIILQNRAGGHFLPARDYGYFIDRTVPVFPRG